MPIFTTEFYENNPEKLRQETTATAGNSFRDLMQKTSNEIGQVAI